MMDPIRQLHAAQELFDTVLPAEVRLRAAALLARQALEVAIARHLAARGMCPPAMPFSTQLTCLRHLIDDTRVVEDAASSWPLLSRACHYHGYELPPTTSDLRQWLEAAERAIEGLAAAGEGDLAANAAAPTDSKTPEPEPLPPESPPADSVVARPVRS